MHVRKSEKNVCMVEAIVGRRNVVEVLGEMSHGHDAVQSEGGLVQGEIIVTTDVIGRENVVAVAGTFLTPYTQKCLVLDLSLSPRPRLTES